MLDKKLVKEAREAVIKQYGIVKKLKDKFEVKVKDGKITLSMKLNKTKLKPCPLCHSEDTYKGKFPHSDGKSFVSGWVGCRNCGVHLEKLTLKEAVKLWNNRAW